MNRTALLLLFGGESSEHDVSVASARNVYAALDSDKFDVLFGYIDLHGNWWLLDQFDADIETRGMPQLAAVPGAASFITLPGNRVIKPDVILPILHGKNGEDGSVQGLAQLVHVPIVGCDTTSSAIGMDKLACKQISEVTGVLVAPYEVYRRGDSVPSFSRLNLTLGNPLFVKPSRGGSSVGVSKVYDEASLSEAINNALIEDDTILIESAIDGQEVEVAALGNPPHHKVSGVGEIKVSGFYSYDEKYNASSKAEVVIPAKLDQDVASKVQRTAKQLFKAFGCKGLSRLDFFVTAKGEVYFNEINTLPGFTNISMYPKLWREQGISYPELVEEMIRLALDN
ncbi:MAG: D-alanine--D-alanine ligase [bacterium]|nr:D-alanine--D-alanine ligase [bacterium]